MWANLIIVPGLQFDCSGGNRVLFSMFQEDLLSVLKSGRVAALPAFRVAQPGGNSATGEFFLPSSSCTVTIELVQCSLFNTWGIQLPEKMGAGNCKLWFYCKRGSSLGYGDLIMQCPVVILCAQTDIINCGNISTINNSFTVC